MELRPAGRGSATKLLVAGLGGERHRFFAAQAAARGLP